MIAKMTDRYRGNDSKKVHTRRDREDAEEMRREPIDKNGCMSHTRARASRRVGSPAVSHPMSSLDFNYLVFAPRGLAFTSRNRVNLLLLSPKQHFRYLCFVFV